MPTGDHNGTAWLQYWPFSQGEIDRRTDALIDAAFAQGPALSRISVAAQA